jgi:hypothetical protein
MTTISMADFTLSPAITLGQADHRQLIVLAMAGLGQTAEDADGLLLRAGQLTAALLLARVEGKSPAPYLTDPEHQRIVRDQARALILAPEPLGALVTNWKRTLA